jgi:tRNA threonylcarbamoyladenosine dehydratase
MMKEIEQLSRFSKLIGQDKLNHLIKKRVVVIGVGGVGSYAVEALVRSGINDITIVDFDKVEITNLNRQLIALKSTIGMAKVDVLEKRILDINSNCKVTKLNIFLDKDNINLIIKNKPDYIIDCCDTVTTKLLIVELAQDNNIPVISSMGTGNRLDPSKLEIVDINKTINDPLAKVMRKLCRDNNIKHLTVLASLELPIKVGDRTPGSSAFVPGSAGLLIASYVVRELLK